MAVKPLQAFLILSFFTLIFVAAFYSYDQQLKYQGVTHMHSDGEQLAMVLGHDLLRFDKVGKMKRTDLRDLGIEQVVGDIALYVNGDVLIRAESQPLSLVDNIKVFLRLSAQNTSEFADARLLRCDLEAMDCRPLPITKSFTRSFKVLLLDNDELMITDTAHHQLLWFDAQGHEKAFVKSELTFPNGMSLYQDHVLIANTNKNAITRIALNKQGFARQAQWLTTKTDTVLWDGSSHRWPTAVIPWAENYIVLLHDYALKNGRLFLISSAGEVLSEFSVDNTATAKQLEGSDYVAMAQFNGQLVVADYSAARVYSFALNSQQTVGQYIGEYSSPALAQLLAQRRQKSEQLSWLLNVILAFAGSVFIMIVIYALWQEKVLYKQLQANVDQHKEHAELLALEKPDSDDADIYWLQPSKVFLRMLTLMPWLVSGISIMMMLLIFQLWYVENIPLQGVLPLLGISSVLILMLLSIYRIAQKQCPVRMGVKGQWILLQTDENTMAIEQAQCVRCNQHIVIVDDAYLLLTHGRHKSFKRQEWSLHIEPLLKGAIKLSPAQMLTFLWQKKDPQMLWALAVLIIIFLAYIAVQ